MCVYPVPLVRETSFGGMCVSIGPSSGAAYRSVVLRLKDLRQDRRRVGVQEDFGHKANLVVYCLELAGDQ